MLGYSIVEIVAIYPRVTGQFLDGIDGCGMSGCGATEGGTVLIIPRVTGELGEDAAGKEVGSDAIVDGIAGNRVLFSHCPASLTKTVSEPQPKKNLHNIQDNQSAVRIICVVRIILAYH